MAHPVRFAKASQTVMIVVLKVCETKAGYYRVFSMGCYPFCSIAFRVH
jgi:hypothetical protein